MLLVDDLFLLNSLSREERQAIIESNRKAMKRNWSNQKADPALKTKMGK